MKTRFYGILGLSCLTMALAYLAYSLSYKQPWLIQKIPRRHPNVIFIILDAARSDHFSCYGYLKDTTPCIDKIAANGTIFLDHFSNASHTMKSVPKYLFSRYYSQNIFQYDNWIWGVKTFYNPKDIFYKLDDEQIILPAVFKISGYKTAIFTNHICFVDNDYVVKAFEKCFRYDAPRTKPGDKHIFSGLISYIRKNKQKNFFIYCHVMSPHTPYPPKQEDAEFLEDIDPSKIGKVREKFFLAKNRKSKGWTKEELEILSGLYDGNLKHTDRWVGALYAEMQKLGLEENTLFIISSDHGESLGKHNRITHFGRPYDTLIKVPLIMIYPKAIPHSVKIDGLTESVDIMPTILDICGIELPEGKTADGKSLFKLMRGEAKGKDAVFTEYSIRTKDYKYIKTTKTKRLFDLKIDPGETQNILKDHPDIAKTMSSQFTSFMKSYKKRFKNSKVKPPLDFPFYLNIWFFDIQPASAIETVYDKRNYKYVLENILRRKKSWVMNNKKQTFPGLFCIPKNTPPETLSMSVSLPDGAYSISLLMESEKDIAFSTEKIGFRSRFDKNKDFDKPLKISYPIKNNKKTCYIDIGKIEIKNKSFLMQIDFKPPDKQVYVFRHIKFSPAESNKKGAKALSEEEMKKTKERLETLGYL